MKKLVLTLLIFPLFFLHAYAEAPEEPVDDLFGTHVLTDDLRERERNISGELRLDGGYNVRGALDRLWRAFTGEISGAVQENLHLLAELCALLLLSGLAAAACPDGRIRSLIELIAAGACGLLLVGGVEGIVSQTLEAMYRISDYSKAALPVVYTAAAAGGAVTSAGAKYAAVIFALDMMMTVSQTVILPFVYAFLSLTLANALFPNAILTAAARFSKWAAGIGMTGMTLAFTAYLGLTSVITGSVDAAAVKTARSVLSGSIPVVGGMLSDVSAMVLSAAGMVRSSAGVFGLIVILAVCAGPFAMLSVRSLVLKTAAVAADSVENRRMSDLLNGIGSTVAMLLGMLGCYSVMLFLSFALGMKAVTG